MQRRGRIAPQQRPHRQQFKVSVCTLPDDFNGSQRSQETAQRRGMHPPSLGQGFAALRPTGEEVGEAEFRGNRECLRDPMAVDHRTEP